MSKKPRAPLSTFDKKKLWKQFDGAVDKDIDCVYNKDSERGCL